MQKQDDANVAMQYRQATIIYIRRGNTVSSSAYVNNGVKQRGTISQVLFNTNIDVLVPHCWKLFTICVILMIYICIFGSDKIGIFFLD